MNEPTPSVQTNILSQSMRDNYNSLGVDEYYKQVGGTYRNPHAQGVRDGCKRMMDKWYALEAADRDIEQITVLDLACGSGEAAEGVQEWLNAAKANGPAPPAPGGKHRAGNVVMTAFQGPVKLRLHAADPYTGAAFLSRTGVKCHSWSFRDVADGCLLAEPAVLDVCVCSFAAHLMDASNLYSTLSQLALSTSYLLILSPHKQPKVTEGMGWTLVEEALVEMRVHARLYKSLLQIY